jgi:E3 ubiquitin-protein ligase RNF5
MNLNEEKKSEDPRALIESSFECHICLEIASEPVLTPCGHLFW